MSFWLSATHSDISKPVSVFMWSNNDYSTCQPYLSRDNQSGKLSVLKFRVGCDISQLGLDLYWEISGVKSIMPSVMLTQLFHWSTKVEVSFFVYNCKSWYQGKEQIIKTHWSVTMENLPWNYKNIDIWSVCQIFPSFTGTVLSPVLHPPPLPLLCSQRGRAEERKRRRMKDGRQNSSCVLLLFLSLSVLKSDVNKVWGPILFRFQASLLPGESLWFDDKREWRHLPGDQRYSTNMNKYRYFVLMYSFNHLRSVLCCIQKKAALTLG